MPTSDTLTAAPGGAVERLLVPCSLAYLALPFAIFLLGWARPPIVLLALGAALCWGWAAYRGRRRPSEPAPDGGSLATRGQWVCIIGVTVALLAVAGIGGLGHQTDDWVKHNAVLRDLVVKCWPTRYTLFGERVPLDYYIGFQLPAALVGKLLGGLAAEVALILWAAIGLILAMLWFVVLVETRAWWAPLLAMLFSGLDLIGSLITTGGVEWRIALDFWSGFVRYQSHTSFIFWVPNQALAAWVGAGLILWALRNPGRPSVSCSALALSALWSPFVAVGLAPFALADLWRRLARGAGLPALLLRWDTLWGGAVSLLLLLFYGAKLGPNPTPYENPPLRVGLVTLDPADPLRIDGAADVGRSLVLFALVCLLEFAVYLYFAWRSGLFEDRAWAICGWIVGGMLSGLLFVQYGFFNDLEIRASIPCLFVLAILMARVVSARLLARRLHLALCLLLLVGATTAAVDYGIQLRGIAAQGGLRVRPEITQAPGIAQYEISPVLVQYIGRDDSLFFRAIAPADCEAPQQAGLPSANSAP